MTILTKLTGPTCWMRTSLTTAICFVIALSITGCTLKGTFNSLALPTSQPSKVALSLSSSSLSLTEGGTALIGFALAKPLLQAATIHVSLVKNGGSPLARFQPFSPTITIQPGQTVGSVTLVTINDAIYEGPESFALSFSSTDLDTTAANLTLTLLDDEVPPTINFTLASQSIQKSTAGVAHVVAQLSGPASVDLHLPLISSGSAVLSVDATLSAATIDIVAGAVSGGVDVTAINDGIVEADRTVVLTMGSVAPAGVATPGPTSDSTTTIVNDLITSFAIAGVTGPGNSTPSVYLAGGLNPTMNWAAATNATNYDVTIYAANGTTVVCPTANTSSLSYVFSSCTLSAGTSYKAKVIAKAGTGSRDASNSPFSFSVNQDPTPGAHGPFFLAKNGAINLSVATLISTDTDSDAGDSVTFYGVGPAPHGGVSISGDAITYTPSAGYTGTDSFTYTIHDQRGGRATATVSLSVVTPFTWVGSAADGNFQTGANWCGAVSADKSGCMGGAAPGSSDIAIFDGVCTSNCTATLSGDTSIGGLNLNAGYTAQLNQAGYVLTIGSAGYSQSQGTFVGSANSTKALNLNGSFSLAGGAFTAPSGTIQTNSNWSVTGTPAFDANGGLLRFAVGDGTNIAVTPGVVQYHSVSFAGNWQSNFDLGAHVMTVNADLLLAGTHNTGDSFINNGTINVSGNVVATNRGMGGNGVVTLVGNAGGQTVSGTAGSALPALNIAAGINQVNLSGTFVTTSNFTITSAGILNAAGASLQVNGNYTVNGSPTYTTPDSMGFDIGPDGATNVINPGSYTYHDVNFYGHYADTFDLGGNVFKVGGNLTFASYFRFNSTSVSHGEIDLNGNVTASNYGSGGNATVKLLGNASGQTISGVSGSSMPAIVLATGSNPVTLTGNVTVAGGFTLTNVGTFDASAGSLSVVGNYTVSSSYSSFLPPTNLIFSTIADYSTSHIAPGSVSYNNVTFNGQYATDDELDGNTLTVGGNLTIANLWGTSGSLNSGLIAVNGNLNIGSWSGGTTNITLTGSSPTVTFAASSNAPGSLVTYNHAGGTLSLMSNVNLSGGEGLTVQAGTVNMSGYVLNIPGLLTINSGATLTQASGALTYGSISNSGTLN